ncbi:MAG: AmmeMemoRadiSam system protein B, partial [Magnetospiraceae bacterium]
MGIVVRDPAVAGSFYPADAKILAAQVEGYLAEASAGQPARAPVPKAVVAPH